jgi:CheY-like chemotaxis protein
MANILVVDDEIDVLEALARALRIAGHTLATAASAADALQLCADHTFDVVVLDYIMPSMSGIELLNKIRAYQPTIRSVIVSGKIDAQVSEETLAAELRNRI